MDLVCGVFLKKKFYFFFSSTTTLEFIGSSLQVWFSNWCLGNSSQEPEKPSQGILHFISNFDTVVEITSQNLSKMLFSLCFSLFDSITRVKWGLAPTSRVFKKISNDHFNKGFKNGFCQWKVQE